MAVFCGVIGFRSSVERLCNAEVGQLYLAILGNENVAGLDVHVDHALAVCSVECCCNIDCNRCCSIGVDRAFIAENFGEALAVDVLHHDERCAILLTLVENPDDVLVVQAGDDLSLLANALDDVLVLRQRRIQNLDRHRAVQQLVTRQEDIS